MRGENLLTRPPSLPLVAASILSADFARLGDDCAAALDAGADLLHLDIMDGHFVPNLTMGPALCRSLRKALPNAFLDVHLMVTDPANFIAPFANAGADHLSVHIESNGEPGDLAEAIHQTGLSAGLTINPPTPVARILPFLDDFEMILVMSVNPGFSGQSFIDAVLEKARIVKSKLRKDQRLEMDGGINARTVASCRDAGCDVIVAASAVFGSDDYRGAIASLRGPTRATVRNT